MSSKIETVSDSEEEVAVSVNEKLLKECHSLYTNKENGLIKIAAEFGLKLFAPRKKIVILILGNHSAGKSTFINWYIGEHVQRTGVAIETQGFTVISSGRKPESLMGNATIHLYPHFKPLKQIPGVIDFLSTEISPSKQGKFPLVMFVDTPGLVDGDTQYPFDVNASVLWLGAMADLVLVFFDPIGQALCRRTLNLVEALHEEHAEKIRFYLSKADDAGDEADRQRVLMQIVQELCKRPGLNRTGFDMPTIYIPEESRPTRCVNQIDEVCREIERTIARNIQNALNSLERDTDALGAEIRRRLETDERARGLNNQTLHKAFLFAVPPLFFFSFVDIILHGANFALVDDVLDTIPKSKKIIIIVIAALVTFISILMFLKTCRSFNANKTLSSSDRKRYTTSLRYIENIVQNRQKQLYREYLEQCVGEDHDL